MNRIDEAFRLINRQDFLPGLERAGAWIDVPLSIGYGQTNSQPSTVRIMLGWLDAQPGHKVLDVGSGSGWTTALLAKLVEPGGQIYAVERIPELVVFGRENCNKYKLSNVRFNLAGERLGLAESAPYDRILVSASAQELPMELVEQLAPQGKMVIPVKYDVLEIQKDQDGKLDIMPHPGFVFVPLL